MESENGGALRELSGSLYSKSWVPSACRGRNPDWSHPDCCGCAAFWPCDLTPLAHSLKKYLLSCRFVPGSVPGAGNKIVKKTKDLCSPGLMPLAAEGDTDKLFHFLANTCFLSLSIRSRCSLWFGPRFGVLSHSTVSLESFTAPITPGTTY